MIHAALGSQFDRYRDPGPSDFASLGIPERLPDDADPDAAWDRTMLRLRSEDDWSDRMSAAVSAGTVDPEDAESRGRDAQGYALRDHATWSDPAPRIEQSWRRSTTGWTDLPHETYHATVDVPGVLAHGLLTGEEYRERTGRERAGLGGTPGVVSLTGSKDIGQGILAGMHMRHHILTGAYSRADLDDMAQEGHGGSEPFHSLYRRLLGNDAGREDGAYTRHLHARAWMFAREQHGGPLDPLFINSDPEEFSRLDPEKFGVVTLHAPQGMRGYRMRALDEWRTHAPGLLVPTHVQRHGKPEVSV